jgi:signal transduction histidine kinase
VADTPGGEVQWVEPESFEWRSGIRPGQRVVALSAADEPGGWSIETDDHGTHYRASSSSATAQRRLGVPFGALASVLGATALASVRTRRRRAEMLGVMGIASAWVPFWVANQAIAGTILSMLAVLGPIWWLSRWSTVRPWALRLVAAGAIALFAALLAARDGAPWLLPALEAARFAIVVLVVLCLLAVAVGVTPGVVARRASTIRLLDAVSGSLIAIGFVLVQVTLNPPLWIMVALALLALLGYRGVRAAATRMIDRVFFVEERERISIQAAEDERARLSRELHDDPLQALAGVILQLEHRPEIDAERKTLRDVAAQLRGVATQLHPPVLDDLGLVPALQSLFAEPGPVDVSIEIENGAGYGRSQRPPAEVELAAYRIIAEAAGNAIRHSGCRHVIVRGRVGPLDLTIDVVDDGRGVRPREIEDAMRAGHLGVASMRRRAEAIDARLAHESHPERGTVVSLRWTA